MCLGRFLPTCCLQGYAATLLRYATCVLTESKVNAPLYIAFLELSWTVFTFATAGVKDIKTLYVFRFL